MDTTVAHQDIITHTTEGSNSTIGVITLNRTKALNALSHSMINNITDALLKWHDDNNVSAVVIKSNSEKAFCAGGDIKSLYENGRSNPNACMRFFYDEYRLNTLIHEYPKPYIALMDGITMGGGAGISIHGKYRLGFENLKFAMPETAIGFYPDIGGSYFLNNYTKSFSLAVYLGLTGYRLNSYEAKELGLTNFNLSTKDHEQFSSKLDFYNYVITKLSHTKITSNNLTALFNNYLNSDKYTQNSILDHIQDIKYCFNTDNINQIFINLENYNNSTWAKFQLELLKSKSPTSLIITFELLKRARELDFKQCMQMEYNLTYGFLKHNDFYEGIRALLIDKDNNPKWDNIKISDYASLNLASYFDVRPELELEFI